MKELVVISGKDETGRAHNKKKLIRLFRLGVAYEFGQAD